MHKQISSTQNPLIKQILLLIDKSRERRKQGLFIIEGNREISLAIKGGYVITTILFVTDICNKQTIAQLKREDKGVEFIEITPEVYQKIAYRSSTEGVIAIAKEIILGLNELIFKTKTPLLLVAEAPEKPGNIGALLRTADAANIDALLIANPKTDLYNPNILRSSVGGVFTNTIATGSSSEIALFLKEKGIQVYCAYLEDTATPYYQHSYTGPTAIVVGTEATGLSKEWKTPLFKNIIIPMQGQIDSMNVSVAAGILIFEAKRQRGFASTILK